MRRATWAAPLLVATLMSAGCRASGPAGGPLSHVWPELRERADSLLAVGELAAAVRLIEAAPAAVRAPYAPDWQRAELAESRRQFSAYQHATVSARESLVVAARAYRSAVWSSQRDSVAQGQRFAADAYASRLAVLGGGSPATALAALELADLSFRLARTGITDSLALQASGVLERAYGTWHPDVALARELLGRSLKNYQGSTARPRALALYREALRIRVATLGPNALAVAAVYHEIGNLERSAGRPGAAIDALRMALASRRAALGPVNDAVASTLSAMAILEGSRGSWAAAESLAAGAVAASPPGAGTPPMSRAFRLGVLGQLLRHDGRPAEAVRALSEAVALNEAAWALSPRDEGSTIQSGLSLHGDLALALADLGRTVEAFAVLERGTSRNLLEHTGGFDTGPTAAWFARLQGQLSPETALVSWVRTRFSALGADEPSWAVIVRDQGPPRWVRLPATADRLPGGVRLRDVFWKELRNAAFWPVRLPGSEREAKLARDMGEAWFEPLRAGLTGVTNIVVCSPELCGGGPLEALASPSGGWLTDQFVITYAPSATLYTRARESTRRWPRGTKALVVGDPAYGEGGEQPWSRLTGGRDEIAAVALALPAAQVLVHQGATAHALRALAEDGTIGRFRMIHLATHTTVDAGHLLESDLVLAPDRPGDRDSRLSAREIATEWHLDADLVFLSGCRPASGMGAAAQGWLGFQYAFLRAGARSVLVSLWPVDDAVAALLVREFYARLPAGATLGSRGVALEGARRAVREWRDPAGRQPFAHPAYWAGFALIGDPGD